ncbi:restriction endonuclease [Streptomyces sp. NPDC021722]|uniref:restriction endonuclease n=1 Tax=Streptomyces sp. NPDC021722 TaxID=3154904 RepID=UPI0033D5C5C6
MNQGVYDPQGLIEANQPYDREPYASLVKAVLAWTSTDDALEPRDYEQIALVLTGHARAVAADLRRRCAGLPKASDKQRALADVVLAEADRRLSTPARGTMRCVQNRARLVRALYERLDRLRVAPPSPS